MRARRVERTYPPLARQIRHSGQVRLHAVIAVDGTIASLEVMDGSPLLVRSALDAVGQWRYQPTLLKGSPGGGGTGITVGFTPNQWAKKKNEGRGPALCPPPLHPSR